MRNQKLLNGRPPFLAAAGRRAAAVLGLFLSLAGTTGLRAQYPPVLPDFSGPLDGAGELFSPRGGVRVAPLLVIYVKFSDLATPVPSSASSTWVHDRIFGADTPTTPPAPSLVDFFETVSNGLLSFRPASESQGTIDDGVVQVNGGLAAGYIDDPREEVNRALRLANPFVDFARYDREGNNDGTLSKFELVILIVRDSRDSSENCGATRTPAGSCTGNGAACFNNGNCGTIFDMCVGRVTSVDGVSVDLQLSTVGTATNLLTACHEVAHVTLDIRDFYGFAVGSLALGGPTCGGSEIFFQPTAFEKIHWGWITPTVVTQDGFYEIDQYDRSGDAYILYNPGRGTGDYFIVENRQRSGLYEANASDSGLVIWRIDENVWSTATEAIRPIEIMRPDGRTQWGCDNDFDGRNGEDPPGDADGDGNPDDDLDGRVDEDDGGCWGGDTSEAWNPADPSTTQRTMTRAWRDGTPASVAVRAVGNSGPVMCAYFDVLGRGLLVDTYNVAASGPLVVAPGETATFQATLMNTNDSGLPGELFDFHFEDLPAGWQTSEPSIFLTPKQATVQSFTVTVPPDAPSQTYTLVLVGRSVAPPRITSRSCSGVPILVVPERRSPDRFEGTPEPIMVHFTEHEHFDERVFLEGPQPVRTTADIWSTTLDRLSLHDPWDVDRFQVTLPDPTAVTPAHPTGIDECGFLHVAFSDTIEEEISVRGSLVIRILPPAGAPTRRIRNAPGESIEVVTFDYAHEAPDQVVIPCPREPGDGLLYNPYIFSYGTRTPGSTRINFPEYRLRVEYRIDIERRLENSSWLDDFTEFRGLGVGGRLPCSGGFFPGCEGGSPFDPFAVVHPTFPGGDCIADGCPDFFVFNWAHQAPFDLFITAPPKMQFSLLSLSGKPLAEAQFVSSALPAVQSFVSGLGLQWNKIPENFFEPPGESNVFVDFYQAGPSDNDPGQAPNKSNNPGQPRPDNPVAANSPDKQDGSPDGPNDPDQNRQRIRVDPLPAGDYVLRVSGTAGAAELQLLPSSAVSSCVAVSESDVKEGGEFVELNIGPVSIHAAIDVGNEPAAFLVSDCDNDGDPDLIIPWSGEDASAPVTMSFKGACGDDEIFPVQVTVSLITGQATVRALDVDGNLIGSVDAAPVYAPQNLTVSSVDASQAIARVEIVGTQMCLTGVCWNCDVHDEPRIPTLSRCEAPGKHLEDESENVNEVRLGSVRITAASDPKSNVIPLQVADCADDGSLDVVVPASLGTGTPATIHLADACTDGGLPTEVTVSLSSDNAVLRAFDASGQAVGEVKAEPPYARYNLTLAWPAGIEHVTVAGAQVCIAGICWTCKIDPALPPPVSVPSGCAKPADLLDGLGGAVESVALGAMVVTSARDPDGMPVPLRLSDCDSDSGVDILVPWSGQDAAEPAAIWMDGVCQASGAYPVEINVLLYSDNAVLRAHDASGHLLDTAAASPPYALQSLVLSHGDGIHDVTIEATQTCIAEICWKCDDITSKPPRFLRGDCNDDGLVDISDAVCVLNWLFLGGTAPGCLAVTDINGDTSTDLSDAVYLLGHLFLGGPEPVEPFPGCGPATSGADAQDCVTPPKRCLQ